MVNCEMPDLDLINRQNQGCRGSATSTAYILRGVDERCNQRRPFAADLSQEQQRRVSASMDGSTPPRQSGARPH
jgi:hypothetical protein